MGQNCIKQYNTHEDYRAESSSRSRSKGSIKKTNKSFRSSGPSELNSGNLESA